MTTDVLQKLKRIHAELSVVLSNPSSRAGRAMSVLKLLEDGDLIYRLSDVITDIEYYDALPNENAQALEKYKQILNIVRGDCQPRG